MVRDLHDGLGQSLTALLVRLRVLGQQTFDPLLHEQVEALRSITAIRGVAEGGTYCTLGDVSHAGVAGAAPLNTPPLHSLSDREREVLAMLARGFTNQQVADKLFLSVKTIESYRSRLMLKLGLKDGAELTQFSMEVGMCGDPSA